MSKRGFWKIHLSTAIIGMFSASVILGTNFLLRIQTVTVKLSGVPTMETRTYHTSGWPFTVYAAFVKREWSVSGEKVPQEIMNAVTVPPKGEGQWSLLPIILNTIIGSVIVLMIVNLSEYVIFGRKK